MHRTHLSRRQRTPLLTLAVLGALPYAASADLATYQQNANGQPYSYILPNVPPPGTHTVNGNFPNNNNWSQSYTTATDSVGNVYETAPSNWSTPNYPNSSSTDVLIPGLPVNLDVSASVANLTLTSPAVLNVPYYSALAVYGPTLSNDGNILINPAAGGAVASLTIDANTLLTGSGTITLHSNGTNAQLNTGAGATLVQASTHTIQGYGQVNAALVNNGTLSANVAGQTLSLQTNAQTNNSLLQATNGGTLNVNGITVTQGISGQLLAANASAITLTNSAISAGTLNSTGTGVIQIAGTSTLDALTNNAQVNIPYSQTLNVTGNLVDNGNLLVNSNSGGLPAALSFNGGTLSGTGSITLNFAGTYAQLNGSLTQSAGHTIQGFGTINAALTNNGTITANVSGQTLLLQTGATTNNSLLQATSSGTLNVNGITVSQGASGQIAAATGSTVLLSNATVSAGTLNSAGTGFFQIAGTSTLASLTSNAHINVPFNHTLNVTGNLVDNGAILVNSNAGGAVAILHFDGGTLSGTGSVTLNFTSSNAQLNGSLTQSATHAIQGLGLINAALTNQGLVNANVSGNTLYVDGPVTNTNLMEATAGGILQFDNATAINNAGGQITANGGNVNFANGASLTGGTLTAVSPNLVTITGYNATPGYSANFNGITIAAGTQVNLPFNNTLSITGATLTNNGNILVNSNTGGAVANLTFNANTLLAGSGTITLNFPGANAQLNTGAADTITQSSTHTIQGEGQINAALINNGTITANVSAQALTLQTNNKTNNKTVQATGGGNLTVNGITLTQGAAGQLSAATGSSVTLNNATLSAGTLSTAGTGFVQIDGTSTLASLTSNAQINLPYDQVLNVTGNLTDNGNILVNSNPGGAIAKLSFAGGTLSGTGSVTLNFAGNNAQLNGSLTQSATHTIQGFGSVNAALTNNGTVTANVAGQTLTLQTNPQTNNKTIQATSGGNLTVNGITLTQGAAGQVTAANSSTVNLTNATLAGGTLASTGTGYVQINGTSTFNSLLSSAKVNVPYDQVLNVVGDLVDNGSILVNSSGGGAVAKISFDGNTLSGSGVLTLNQIGTNAQIAGALTQAAPHTIQGFGQINAALTNNGTVSANVNAQTLAVTGPFTNNGSVRATGGGTLQFSAGVLSNLVGNVLAGGSFQVDANSTITLPGSIVTNGASVTLNGIGATFNALSALAANNGTFTIKNGANFTRTGPFTNNLLVSVGPSSTLHITGPLTNAALLDVAGGTVILDQGLAGDTVINQIHAAWDNGAWDGSGITSSLAALDATHLTGVGYLLTGASYTLKRTYYGDANLDGKINADDFALTDRAVAQHLSPGTAIWQSGDFNYDGTVNSADYLLLDRSYALQSGPLSPAFLAGREAEFGEAYVTQLLASVPEPALPLFSMLYPLSSLLLRRRRTGH